MPVQNFLEDEDYEAESVDSSVPDFLQDEEYDDASGDEYYGGGFSDGVEEFTDRGAATIGFGGYGEDEEELFDGRTLFEHGEEDDPEPGGDSSPYGISGVTPRLTTSPATPSSSASPTVATTVDTSVSTVDEESEGFVPNFLEDEDDEESSPGSSSSAGSTKLDSAVEASRESASAPRTDGSSRVESSVSTEPARPRRDLSRRAPQSEAAPGSAPTSSRELNSDGASAPRTAPTEPGASASTSPQGSSRSASPTTTVSFDPRAKSDDPSERELQELKTPSSYAAGRELKYTAMKQKDATVRRVGSDGRTPAERARMAKANPLDGLRTPSNGKLSQEELLFYANLGAQRSRDYGSSSKKKLFLPPVLGESAEQKREREARINRALAAGSIARGAKTRLTEKDYRVLQFMALFKFVSERQIAKLLQVAEITAFKRLNDLRKHGLTKGFKTLGVKGSVWVLTETGMDLSGYDLPRGTESGLTLSMVSHQFTVNHAAAHLWSGGANVLQEKSFPQRNLPDGNGGFGFGDRLISELQIQSALGKVRGTTKAEAYVPQIKKHMANQFDGWKRAGGVDFGPSPELQPGNEYMLALFPPVSNRLNHHVPDLVVARPRAADGKPQSIAVEVELKTKADDSSYERTLDAYRVDSLIFKKVVWICRLKGTAERLMKIAQRNGLLEQRRIAIVPIYLEDGSIFTGKDTWSL